ncbi:hypothetical protein D9M68_607000 [compost metagenome]
MKFWAFAFSIALFFGLSQPVIAQITAASCPESAQYYAKDSINVITFGASTVEGVNGLSFQPYLTSNFLRCYSKKTINIQKYGIGGETTAQGLLRIDDAIANKTGFIVILMGANDAIHIESGKLTIEQTEANMRMLISKSMKQRLIPVICTIQNFDDRKQSFYKRVNQRIAQINQIYRQLTVEYGIYLADINSVMRRDFSLYQDFVHPNTRGNRLISFVLFDTINRIIAERFLQFTVSQNYPNPGRDKSLIDIVMPSAAKVDFKIYDLQNRLVKVVLNEYLNTGKHTIQLDLSTLTSGIYIYRVNASNGLSVTKKMVVIH